MFKNKFKELVQNKRELSNVSFEILNEMQATTVIGGCGVLRTCGIFEGSCNDLSSCQRFKELTYDYFE